LTDDGQDNRDLRGSWLQWPPTPRMQIVLIALAFGLINLTLLVIWVIALVMTR